MALHVEITLTQGGHMGRIRLVSLYIKRWSIRLRRKSYPSMGSRKTNQEVSN